MDQLHVQRGYSVPQVVQFSVFLDNRVGKLRELVRLFDGTEVQVAALSVVDTADCAIVRCVLVPSDEARALLRKGGLPATETDLVVVEMSAPGALGGICDALVKAEIFIYYAYPLLSRPHGQSALALHVDEPALAGEVLGRSGFVLLGEADLG